MAIRALVHPRALAMLFLGFSAGLPILLIFSTLSVWLREAGVERSTVTFFSWAALGYSFKFVVGAHYRSSTISISLSQNGAAARLVVGVANMHYRCHALDLLF